MIAEAPADYMLTAYVSMLKEDGPLWITMGDGLSSHALVLVGIYGSVFEETPQAYEDSVFEFIDPANGSYSYLRGLDFMKDFEREVRVIVDSTDIDDLRWQIIHWPPHPT